VCSKGSATWDGGSEFKAQAVTGNSGFFSDFEDCEITIPENAKSGAHRGLIDEFINCIIHGGTPETAAEDNIKSLAMVFGAIESAETGKRVEIRI
jgi:predicted dehydrogenase